MATNDYQRKIFKAAVKRLLTRGRVGLDIFTRGGKSYIAMDIIEYMLSRDACVGKYALILGPKSVLDNLEGSVMKKFKYKKRLLFLNYEKLSRQWTVTKFLESNNIAKEDIELIVMDEAHKAFGEICRKTFLEDEEYINSKYLVAMTATPYSNLSGINSLDELVGENNSIRYHYDEAIRDKVARKINYVPAILSYDPNILDKLIEIRKNCNDTDYLAQLLDRFEKLQGDLVSNEAKAISSYITENVQLDSSNGARVFVFFSSIEKLEEGKDTVISAIVQAYKNWGNKLVKHRYMNFTSASSEEEIDNIREKLARKPLKNTIDIVCTVQMGVMGIHPSNTHFALMMSATTSLQKLMQMIGRVTNLYAYDDADTTVFDLKDSLKALDKVRYNVNAKELLKDLLDSMYEEDEHNLEEYSSLVNIKSSKITSDSLELLAKIRHIAETIKEVDDVLAYILKDLEQIDSKKQGNTLAYLKNKRLYSYKDYERRSVLRIETMYKSLLNIIFSDNYDNDIKRTVKEKMSTLGHRIYILETYDTKQCIVTSNSYKICKVARDTGLKTDKLISYVIEPLVMGEALTGVERIIKDLDVLEMFSDAELASIKDDVIERRRKEDEEAKQLEEENKRKAEEKALAEKQRREAAMLEAKKRKEANALAHKKMLEENEAKRRKNIEEYKEYIQKTISETNKAVGNIGAKIDSYNESANKIYCLIRLLIDGNKVTVKRINLTDNTFEYYIDLKEKIKDISDITAQLQEFLNTSTGYVLLNNKDIAELLRELEAFNYKADRFYYYDSEDKITEKVISSSKLIVQPGNLSILKSRFGNSSTINIECHSHEDYIKYKNEIENITDSVLFVKLGKTVKIDTIAEYTYMDILENFNNTDYMTALFITILNGTVKEVHNLGGYTYNARLDSGDIDYLGFTLKQEVGLSKGSAIMDKATEYKQRDDVKFLLALSQDDIPSYSVIETVNKYAELYNSIESSGDSVLKYLSEILKICNKDSHRKFIGRMRNRVGFKFYHDIFSVGIQNTAMRDVIYEALEFDIKDNFNLALYYAIDLNDENIEREIFNTTKYDEQIENYLADGEKQLAKISDSLAKYNKIISPKKKAKAKNTKVTA